MFLFWRIGRIHSCTAAIQTVETDFEVKTEVVSADKKVSEGNLPDSWTFSVEKTEVSDNGGENNVAVDGAFDNKPALNIKTAMSNEIGILKAHIKGVASEETENVQSLDGGETFVAAFEEVAEVVDVAEITDVKVEKPVKSEKTEVVKADVSEKTEAESGEIITAVSKNGEKSGSEFKSGDRNDFNDKEVKKENVRTSDNENQKPEFETVQTAVVGESRAVTPKSVVPDEVVTQTVDGITEQITEVNGETNKVFTIALNPDGLGKVMVRFVKNADKIALTLSASNPVTAKILSDRMSVLQSSFNDHNIAVDNIKVEKTEGGSEHMFHGETSGENSQSGKSGESHERREREQNGSFSGVKFERASKVDEKEIETLKRHGVLLDAYV